MKRFVGVDGGATHALAHVTNASGAELARAGSDAISVAPGGNDETVARIEALVDEVLERAGAGRPAAALCCGLTGAGREPERAALEAAVGMRGIALSVRVTTDLDIAFFDAFGEGAGILLIAGTGSAACGRAPDGRTARAGGWGPRAGDEGSAFAIGSAALRAVLSAHDGRAGPTALTDRVLRATRLADAADLVRWSDTAGKHGTAALAPHVLALATTDEAAAGIARAACTDLVHHVIAIARRLEPWDGDIGVAFAGGLISSGRPLRAAVQAAVAEALPRAHVLEHAVDAARGAAALARRMG
ncbi:MAG: hypothetical protein L0271_04665 [Gemmatimonadetes bacterium]|nr:hypothetical protein [Gemmatimonadota bacterium]